MMRRRPGGHNVGQRMLFLAIALFLLNPALVHAQQQQQQQPQQQQRQLDKKEPKQPQELNEIKEPKSHPNIRTAVASYVSPAEADAFAAAAASAETVETVEIETTKTKAQRPKTKSKSLTEETSPASQPSVSFSTSTGQSARLSQAATPDSKTEKSQNNNSNTKNTKNAKNSKNTKNTNKSNATVAPDLSVRAPSLAHRDLDTVDSSDGLGLASPHIARSLADWEVEDFVLLATVDGDLHSLDRKTGKTLWHTESEKPVVETIHHRSAVSVDDKTYSALDHWTWAVEPSGNGAIYAMIPGATGLAETGLSMKAIVGQEPYHDRKHPVVFIGTKDSTMMTLDAATGHIRQWYGSGDADGMGSDSGDNIPESCSRPGDYFDDGTGGSGGEECFVGGTITLGRTDYKVIVRRTDGTKIATLRYSEWGPNNYDSDLHRQYRQPSDNRYITGKPSGDVYGFSVAPRTGDVKLSFTHRLETPVVRVFDVARPPSVPLSSNPDLALLPQPPPPVEDEEDASLRRASVFVNQTETGGWYALSGSAYPLIVDNTPAECTRRGWWVRHQDTFLPAEYSAALTGKHVLASSSRKRRPLLAPNYPTLPGSDGSFSHDEDKERERERENGSTVPLTLPGSSESSSSFGDQAAESVIAKVKELPQVAANRVLDFFSNPVFLIAVTVFFFVYHKDLRRWYNRQKSQWWKAGQTARAEAEDESSMEAVETDTSEKTPEATSAEVVPDGGAKAVEADSATDTTESSPSSFPGAEKESPDSMASSLEDVRASASLPTAETSAASPLASPVDDSTAAAASPSDGTPPPHLDGAPAEPEKEKKKAHRGRRGGAKHRKGGNGKAKSEASLSRGDDAPPPTVDEVVGQAKRLGEHTLPLEPDILTVSNANAGINDMEEVSTPIMRMGSLEVNQNVQLGTGSNGTVVFAGKFDGREVAVKRMLIQFYDIASQETKLLRESDDHPNVIRYYAQQQRANFHYIALELCQASLGDVVEKPGQFRELAQAGERDLPNVLYQITSGLNHLHARSIVHRDLKPQNILVNMSADGKPRMLISDFGLCKKLEGGASSFGATTAHAAGTSGWRAPELLLDDDARDNGQTMVESAMSTQSGVSATSGSGLVHNPDGTVSRRATKAIDIFSLGLVFYYVLTKGSHPFDCGDRYMREVNIRKDTYNLDGLDVLGDFAFEAKDLVEHMISRSPQHRPRTRAVMAHPFFWSPKKRLAFLCDVSDHFEKEPRDPPSEALASLEALAPDVCRGDFLKRLPKDFVDSLGKQRKYRGDRLLDLLRALRNKRNHYEDMSEPLRRMVGALPEGYLAFWTMRFPNLLIGCWALGIDWEWADTDRFVDYYQPAGGV
ncbi:serine/threonineeeee-protein kinase/endoribonuclease IRE1 [Sporothrix schenckii 1099-18]|uniref:non-specific serine/threonine protein kinase n=1 Tax=Sporothrix schenckii 1099-18 TaxID=1397361 RepID=A0A0F2MC62_SPOSC|nr:serine/threonineeeee-protein kinase/endoribonuclease IRE1 [Sporothrix schenckii 1099-18]KJR87293.1 serine/threonineeeee-protein kinase/endoribonuclease IRE1 [Sporothrix schenckii 1099-18]